MERTRFLLHQRGIIFVIVAKAGMTVAIDAQALAKMEASRSREQVVRHGHGKNAREERLRTELVGIEALTTYDAYGEADQKKQQYRRDFDGQPINAVVVQMWNNRAPSADGIVYLTNGPVSDPFVVFDDYSFARSLRMASSKRASILGICWRFPRERKRE